MQLGEPVFIGMPPQTLETQCPFSHEKPNPEEKNELGGIGQTLGKNMAKKKGVHTSKPPFGGDYTIGDEDKDPRDRLDDKKIVAVQIKVNHKTVMLDGETLWYPLTCAAHHLIPAQESLRDHPILKFMCKHGDSQDFRKSGEENPHAVPGSKVWGNVAYNVNGQQNGVWLPGNYAVGAGTGGIAVWMSRLRKRDKNADKNWENKVEDIDMTEEDWKQMSVDPEEDEEPDPLPSSGLMDKLSSVDPKEYLLVGKNYDISPANPKWAYVKAAMDATSGLFHDKHGDYSQEVLEYLNKISEAYHEMKTNFADCDKCKEAARPDGVPANTVGPPYGVVARLVACSSFFKRHVQTKRVEATNIYTSKWVKSWIETETGPY